MLNRFKSAIYSVVNGYESGSTEKDAVTNGTSKPSPKFPYSRPKFLQLHSNDEMLVASDHSIRPIIVPRDISGLPWFTGYAEAVNAGKSSKNEDQAAIYKCFLERNSRAPSAFAREVTESCSDSDLPEPNDQRLPYHYFALFDGHAGSGAAVAAANQLHYILHEKLVDVIDHLLPPKVDEKQTGKPIKMWIPDKELSMESFVVGALEAAFWEMDELIGEDKHRFKMTGGCTALVALFILGKLFVANAGDCRAILCRGTRPFQLSTDFTPESERQRIRKLAALKPEFLGNDFTALDYYRRPTKSDIGQRMLYREPHMTGWAYKTITVDDLKFPVVFGEGKRSRVLATIGVTRGFGDHDLRSQLAGVPIKPFLTAQPEVRILDLDRESVTESDILILRTDGLWDVTTSERAAEVAFQSMEGFPVEDQARYKYRFTSAAQDLVMSSRGKLTDRAWRTIGGKTATVDDISVFVIPLLPYKLEYDQWRNQSLNDTTKVESLPPVKEVVVEEVVVKAAVEGPLSDGGVGDVPDVQMGESRAIDVDMLER